MTPPDRLRKHFSLTSTGCPTADKNAEYVSCFLFIPMPPQLSGISSWSVTYLVGATNFAHEAHFGALLFNVTMFLFVVSRKARFIKRVAIHAVIAALATFGRVTDDRPINRMSSCHI